MTAAQVLLLGTVFFLNAGFEYRGSAYLNGQYSSAVIADSLMYVADGRGVSVFHAQTLRRLGGCYLPGKTSRIAGFADGFFVAGDQGLVWIDGADVVVDRPDYTIVDTVPATAIAMAGENLWFADDGPRLRAWDASVGEFLGEALELAAPVVRIVPVQDRLYLACDTAGLWMVELADGVPDVKKVQLEDDPPVMDIVIKDDVAWLACAEQGLWAVDLGSRRAKVVSKSEISGEVLELADYGRYLAAATGVGDFALFLIEDSDDPQVAGHAPVPGFAQGLARSGETCMVLFGSGFRRLELDGNQIGGGLTYNGRGRGWEILTRGQVGVIAAGDAGVKTFSVADDGSVELMGTYADAADCRGVRMFGSQVFALPTGNRMYVVNLTDPAAPAKKTFVDFAGPISGTDVDGEMALVAELDRGLGSWWRCPCGPLKEQGRIFLGASVLDVQVKDRLGYAVTDEPALHVIDFTDSTAMVKVAELELEHTYSRVYLLGDNLIGLDSTGRLGVMDVSRTSRPRMLGTVELAGAPCGLALDGDLAYVASGNAGLHLVDLSNPTSPVLTETLDASPARGAALAGDILIISTPWALETYKINTQAP